MPRRFSSGQPIGIDAGQRFHQRGLAVVHVAGGADNHGTLPSTRSGSRWRHRCQACPGAIAGQANRVSCETMPARVTQTANSRTSIQVQTTLFRLLPATFRRSATLHRRIVGRAIRPIWRCRPGGPDRRTRQLSTDCGIRSGCTALAWSPISRLPRETGCSTGRGPSAVRDRDPAHRQWGDVHVNQSGRLVPESRHLRLVGNVRRCRRRPTRDRPGAGAMAGMFVNFGLSGRLVFR